MSFTLVDAVAGYARTNGIQITPDQIEATNEVLRTYGRQGDDGAISFEMDGKAMTFWEIMATQTASLPRDRKAAIKAVDLAGMTATERARAINAARAFTEAQAKAAEASRIVDRYGNPWRTGNRTHQAFLTAYAPQLADRLRQQTGGR